MDVISRTLRTFTVLAALLLTCLSISFNWLGERASLSEWLDDCTALLEAQRKGEQLEQEAEVTIERILAKGRIAEKLRKGEITLIEAAGIFRWLYEDPLSWHHPHRQRPASKDGESWCREVIAWTDCYYSVAQSPSQAQMLHQRLEAELQEQMKRHGMVPLPE